MSYDFGLTRTPDDVFRSLADPTRRGILENLMQSGEQNVRALTEHAGVSQAAVSKHLSVLKSAGLVRDRPQGRTVHYTAQLEGLTPLVNWLEHYASFWRDRLDRLETLLDGLDDG